jgi:glutaredoxin-like protein NrdH
MDATGFVEGRRLGDIVVYALSTCVWCSMAKALLDRLGVAYRYIHMDLLPEGEREVARAELRRWNPRGSFPTLVFDGERAVLGYDEAKIRGELGL